MILDRIRHGWKVAAAVAILLVAHAGCTSGGAGETAALSESFDDAVAHDFTLDATDGTAVKLSDSAGRVRLVDFWATWCAPCREEIPMLKELHESYGARGLQILAISEEEPDVIREFAGKHEIPYVNLVGTAEVAEKYGVYGLPSAYLIDGEGKIIESFQGAKPRRVLESKIRELLEPAL